MAMSVCFEAIMLKNDKDDMYLLLGMYSVVIICGLLISFFSSYHKRILNESRQENELTILRSQISSNQKTIEVQKELYQMKHDIKHFLQAAKSFDHKNEETQKEIASFSDRFDNLSIPVQTLIPALSHTLNIARDEAKEKGIDFVCNLNITKPLNIDDNDLYLLFCNLFDNAIRHIGIQKKIDVYAKNTEEIFAIKVSNSVDKQVIDERGSLITKRDDIEHGYGLATVESIIHKYNGTITYSQDNNLFVVTISVPY
ncbi:MAG: sensor histidine kinase [Erysipelotrichaceae bacterium]|nr:sensor histidine kinase [Erysipelotrichaceae bacterium]